MNEIHPSISFTMEAGKKKTKLLFLGKEIIQNGSHHKGLQETSKILVYYCTSNVMLAWNTNIQGSKQMLNCEFKLSLYMYWQLCHHQECKRLKETLICSFTVSRISCTNHYPTIYRNKKCSREHVYSASVLWPAGSSHQSCFVTQGQKTNKLTLYMFVDNLVIWAER